MSVENDFKFKIEELKCQKCGRQISEGSGNVCRSCLAEINQGVLTNEDLNGTIKSNTSKHRCINEEGKEVPSQYRRRFLNNRRRRVA